VYGRSTSRKASTRGKTQETVYIHQRAGFENATPSLKEVGTCAWPDCMTRIFTNTPLWQSDISYAEYTQAPTHIHKLPGICSLYGTSTPTRCAYRRKTCAESYMKGVRNIIWASSYMSLSNLALVHCNFRVLTFCIITKKEVRISEKNYIHEFTINFSVSFTATELRRGSKVV
jgi:hypothetical protein